MENPLIVTLLITAIGMGLVFVALLLLWGLMEAMVRLTVEKPEPEQPPELPEGAAQGALALAGDAGQAQKARAAAAAVAVALKLNARRLALDIAEQPANLRAWQTVQRAGATAQRNSAYNRKPRGNAK